jgi:hypothetical protein
MTVCSGCGFKNRPDRVSCSKCGQVFREQKDVTPLLKKIGSIIVGVLVIVIALVKIFGPSKMEAKRMRFEEREAKKARAAEEPPAPPEPKLAAKEPVPPPPPRPAEPEEPSPRERAEEYLRRADQFYGNGDYTGAAEAYQQAERLGVWTPESREKKAVCASIAYILMYRDYLDKENLLEPARLVGAKSNLALIKPATLPTDAWREEHRKTLARVDQAYKILIGEDKSGNLIPDPDAFNRSFSLILQINLPGKISGAVVGRLDANGLLAGAGVRNGDLIIEINGRRADSEKDFADLVARIERDGGFWGTVLRKGDPMPFRVVFPLPGRNR